MLIGEVQAAFAEIDPNLPILKNADDRAADGGALIDTQNAGLAAFRASSPCWRLRSSCIGLYGVMDVQRGAPDE